VVWLDSPITDLPRVANGLGRSRSTAVHAEITAARLLAACFVAGAAWVVAEVAGGLFFLALGVRLWRYELVPLFWDITSPIVWLFAVGLIVPLSIGYDRIVACRWRGRGRLVARLLFVMSVGPVLEVLINEFLFKAAVGRALYIYTTLPTFSGSWSWLSPFYYATLLIHVPITDRLLGASAPAQHPP